MRCRGLGNASLVVALISVASLAQAQPTPYAERAFEGRAYPAHWTRAPLLDRARAAARVDVAWQRFGVLGRGATVCVVDTGVDLTHRDLRDAANHTRVDWLLDLDRAPRGSEPALEARFGGAVFRGDELDAMLATSDRTLPTDWHGHGTAIASAAVGDDAAAGVDTPGPFAGVAPLARLVVVRALRRGTPGFADDDIARGVAFCAAVVDPRHAVAVLSLGGHDGAHDGTSAIEVALAEQVHAGLAIVVAAGNDGGRALHAAVRIADGAIARVGLHVPAPAGTSLAHVAVAVRGASDVAIVAPDGSRVRVRFAGERVERSTPRGRLVLDATRGSVVDATISGDAGAPLRGGEFILELRGPARVDAWIVSADLGATPFGPAFVGPNVVPGEEVTMPATSDAVIAVGASVSRSALTPMDGSRALTLEADADGRAIFSSRGPSASGALRPDVLAPGGWTVAARSSAVDPSDPEALVHGRVADWSRLIQPNDRLAIAGTSVSAAIVAGALALAIEAAPSDPERDRALLALTAIRDDAAVFTASRGFGAIDVAVFLGARAARDGDPVSAAMSPSRAFTTPGATDLSLALIAHGVGGGVPNDAWVAIARDGVTIARAPLRAGIARLPVEVGRALPGTRVTWSARTESGSATATTSVDVRWTDDGGGAIASGGGGCAIAGSGARSRARSDLALVLALALATVAARRARA